MYNNISSRCLPPCEVTCTQPWSYSNSLGPCVASCGDSRAVVFAPPVVVNFPGPIISSCPQESIVGTSFPETYGPYIPYSSGSSSGMGGSFGSGGMSGMGGSFGSGGMSVMGGSYGSGGSFGSGGMSGMGGSYGYGGSFGSRGMSGMRGSYGYGGSFGSGGMSGMGGSYGSGCGGSSGMGGSYSRRSYRSSRGSRRGSCGSL